MREHRPLEVAWLLSEWQRVILGTTKLIECDRNTSIDDLIRGDADFLSLKILGFDDLVRLPDVFKVFRGHSQICLTPFSVDFLRAQLQFWSHSP